MAEPLPPLVPVPEFAPQLLLRTQPVRALILDVDGVLTDGGLYFSGEGEVLKRFDSLDGHGLKLLQQAGITPVVVSGRDAPALRVRLAALGITHQRLGVEAKLPAAQALLAELALGWGEVAVIGDDWPDLPLLRRAQLACAPAQAHAQARALAHYRTLAAGGHGAVRELCDLLLTAGGHYARLLAQLP
ncbi:KdsC family phosphatase [Comamonas flocculans]|uniref:3-deoxy-D-manno-octulosonate 8-phosphate phosphatase KdsC n=1 Tax=Comamonas flocculans TaxID=2597701 RepID=A0A5B8RV38_9BURK|nr:3-deoxy-D-manno-octulosonate 8-phosphate phosphatase [Comamonas flocculans]QEA12983.1 3-deoxy-D-manno-octulosonate 8-phosphate phosphatase [Comamonas flocculans]